MIKAILVDDEKHALITLEHLLKKNEDVEILTSVQSSLEAKELIDKLQPDLLFLDIEMSNLNGFELLQQFDQIPFKVIFTTAYDQYAIKALKINALDYLLKPIDPEELRNALDRYIEDQILTSEEQISHLNQFKNSQMTDTLALSTSKGLFFIKIQDIMYFEADGSYTHVILNNGESHLVSKSLANFEEVLDDDPLFFRSHKSHLVNLKFIKQYIRGEGGELIMQNGKSIVLSRIKKQEFLNLFKKI
ncbi:LytR/AlgR family response regulator transcription factor [Moheibacter stercoris]|uniref:Two-component system LytT family response regulator n=1 Tax=Moheibacter stercoris TaxID=1628251 RepID=A0ABV2LVI3_9FLAO